MSEFVSRRTLVLRRFRRNRSAVAALVVLVALFIGCYALPPLLPYSTRNWTTTPSNNPRVRNIGSEPLPSARICWHRFSAGCRSRCSSAYVAAISTTIAATVGSFAGFFGGWRDRALMWVVDLLLEWCRASS